MYSEEPEGMRRAQSEFVTEEDELSRLNHLNVASIYQPTEPLYTGPTALPELNLSVATSTDQAPLRRSNRIRKQTKPADHDYEWLYMTKRSGKAKEPTKVTVEEIPNEESDPLPGLPLGDGSPSTQPPSGTIHQNSFGDKPTEDDETTDPEKQDLDNTGSVAENPKPFGESGNTEATPPVENQRAPEPLAAIASSGEGIDIYGAITGRYGQDCLFKDVIADPARYRNFESRDGLLFLKDGGKSLLCIPDIKLGDCRVREILITYAHSLLAHLGSRKTVLYLRDHVWWKGLVADVEAYCESCNICSMTK
ncbi:hypothetical protein FRC01_012956 [Tulasnella sp. 417]|nr:hypothetical protein FRC01_012956 [Tulasnella sp. 417]